jgi:hypothetical protein
MPIIKSDKRASDNRSLPDLEDGHYIAIISVGKSDITFEDPANKGSHKMTHKQLNDRWHGLRDDNKTIGYRQAVIISDVKKYQDGGLVKKNLPEVNINGLPQRYLDAVRAQHKSDSIANLGNKGWNYSSTEYNADGSHKAARFSDSDERNKYEKRVVIPGEWWEETNSSMVPYTPKRGIIPVAEVRRQYPGVFEDNYGVEPIGYRYTHGRDEFGSYAPVFNTDINRYRNYQKLAPRGFKNDATPGVIIPEPKEATLPERPLRHRRTWSREEGQGYERYVQDEDGNVLESQPMSKEDWYKVDKPMRGKTSRILKNKK